jgi:hypothetical protein
MRGTAGTAASTNTNIESGSGGAHTAGTGIESTQGYKPTSSLIKHLISTILLVVLFSSTVENAFAFVQMFMFMLVSITSFLWIKVCCKMARFSTTTTMDHSRILSNTSCDGIPNNACFSRPSLYYRSYLHTRRNHMPS